MRAGKTVEDSRTPSSSPSPPVGEKVPRGRLDSDPRTLDPTYEDRLIFFGVFRVVRGLNRNPASELTA